MAPTVPTAEPRTAAAGDSWLWTVVYGDFPSSEGWTLSYSFRGPSLLDTAAAEVTTSGTGYAVTIAASRTADLTPGNYRWAALMTGSGAYAGRVYTAGTGLTEVTRNLALASEGDAQSWEEKTLAVIEAVLTNKITDDVASYQIAGRQVVTLPLDELLALQARCRRAIARAAGRVFAEHLVVLP